MTRAQARWLHTLYLTYAETLYRLARWRLGDPVRAQDLTHNVFLAASGKIQTLQNHPNPLGWLLRALQYELSHEFARRDREPLPLESLPPAAAVPPPTLGLTGLLPKELSPRDREILLLYYGPIRRSPLGSTFPCPPAAPGWPGPEPIAAVCWSKTPISPER